MQCLRTGMRVGIGLAAAMAAAFLSGCTGAIGPDGAGGSGSGPASGGGPPGQSPLPPTGGGGGNGTGGAGGVTVPPGAGTGPATVPGAPAPGQLRRLTAAQFRRALADLLGTTAALPAVEESPASASLRSIGSYRILSTIASAVGVRKPGGELVDDFGDQRDVAVRALVADLVATDAFLHRLP